VGSGFQDEDKSFFKVLDLRSNCFLSATVSQAQAKGQVKNQWFCGVINPLHAVWLARDGAVYLEHLSHHSTIHQIFKISLLKACRLYLIYQPLSSLLDRWCSWVYRLQPGQSLRYRTLPV
jgi:hypothetical protein